MQHWLRGVPLCGVIGTCIALAACGSDSNGPNATPDIAGTWAVTAAVSNSSTGVTCSLQGEASIQQSGSSFDGQLANSTAACSGPGGTTTENADGPLTNGQITGTTVSYADEACVYTGTVSGSPSDSMTGSVTCQTDDFGTLTGTWTASR